MAKKVGEVDLSFPPTSDAVRLGSQLNPKKTESTLLLYSIVATTSNGDTVPGKSDGNNAWYCYGGKGYSVANFKYTTTDVSMQINDSKDIPKCALKNGLEQDRGATYSVIAITQFGTIPGKAYGPGVALYEYDNKELQANSFYWLTVK